MEEIKPQFVQEVLPAEQVPAVLELLPEQILLELPVLELFMEANEGRDLRDKGNVKAVTRNGST